MLLEVSPRQNYCDLAVLCLGFLARCFLFLALSRYSQLEAWQRERARKKAMAMSSNGREQTLQQYAAATLCKNRTWLVPKTMLVLGGFAPGNMAVCFVHVNFSENKPVRFISKYFQF